MTPAPRRRKIAVPQTDRTVKATVIVDADTHVRWAAAAAMANMDRSAWAAVVIREALRGVIVVDRRKTAGQPDANDRPGKASPLDSDGEIPA
jgi:hypothetical protein